MRFCRLSATNEKELFNKLIVIQAGSIAEASLGQIIYRAQNYNREGVPNISEEDRKKIENTTIEKFNNIIQAMKKYKILDGMGNKIYDELGRTGREDRHHRRLQGRPADPVVGGLRQAGRAVRPAWRILCLGHPAVQHHHLDGASDPERAAVVCTVRAGGHVRTDPGQGRCLQAQRTLGRWHGPTWLRYQ